MDNLDRKIIGILTDDGRISATELASRLPLSLSATAERLRRLSESGIIQRFTIQVDPDSIGRRIEALIDVRWNPDAESGEVEDSLLAIESIVDAVHITGRFGTQLHVAAKDVAELDRLLDRLKGELGAAETNTRLVLRTLEGFPRPAGI